MIIRPLPQRYQAAAICWHCQWSVSADGAKCATISDAAETHGRDNPGHTVTAEMRTSSLTTYLEPAT